MPFIVPLHKAQARFPEYSFIKALTPYIVEGTDLSEVLKLGKQWAVKKTALFFVELCNGLYALRLSNVVHRDLKPTNIRVRPNGTPVIIDFGLARHLDQPGLTRTSKGAAFGTPLYFAPEQFIGTKYDIDHRTDLFALGILLYQALVGRHPFHHPRSSLMRMEHLTTEDTEGRRGKTLRERASVFLRVLSSAASDLAQASDPRVSADQAITILETANNLHEQIKSTRIVLADSTNVYQANQHDAMSIDAHIVSAINLRRIICCPR
jgi:serine/threonine protein kinase